MIFACLTVAYCAAEVFLPRRYGGGGSPPMRRDGGGGARKASDPNASHAIPARCLRSFRVQGEDRRSCSWLRAPSAALGGTSPVTTGEENNPPISDCPALVGTSS
jgi:hypothetical protein